MLAPPSENAMLLSLPWASFLAGGCKHRASFHNKTSGWSGGESVSVFLTLSHSSFSFMHPPSLFHTLSHPDTLPHSNSPQCDAPIHPLSVCQWGNGGTAHASGAGAGPVMWGAEGRQTPPYERRKIKISDVEYQRVFVQEKVKV